MITSYEKYEMLLKISETNSYQVANDTGVGYSSLSDWKRGKSRLKTDKLRILAEYFGVDTGFFRDGDAITGYDIIKDYAFVSTCNRARNLEWLRNSPYEPFLDMALIYNLTIGIGSMPDRSVHISDSHLELLGINKQTLKESAWENTKRIRPACTASMGRFMREVGYADALKENPGGTTYGDDVIPAFMLSSEHGYHGAVYMLDNKTMKKAAAELKGNLIVLPYSIRLSSERYTGSR